ncbi:amino acid ABC transporter permease [Carbonactinospora thermoautotrophica]|uniref:Amino acid ABC transporter permease n=1 Tax=Carbonactinospora thermoautotrophica TaxID=1469144 RepID=A0A132MPG4_9ACTN|nr:amino acid ABC transporter permease [Carbonactinospora thermoautotrophica]KWW99754.1 Polar amino acid ABC transporter [Carbonactinospora thermoautotrophica]KWX04488.1 amino acid ABC transporter permease [Carbonactinospora thermoautotrophica]KWX08979.1 amino acid ABC transporter permease [Carbonactinospora thermoautotrophica]MCX9191248.1 amino acid ABC transporter permease [Carbonactinospora thermoautotrophica]
MLRILTDNWDIFGRAIATTLALTVLSGVLSLLWGSVLATMRVCPVPALRRAGSAYVNVLRNTPLTLVFLFIVFGLPSLQIDLTYFQRAVLSLTLYTSAFVCEAIRSGINTVPVGQAEAARSIGMTFWQTLTLVVLPQAFRAVVPPLGSVLIAMTKNTTIAAGFAVTELGSVRQFLSERGEPAVPTLIWVALIFLAIVLPMAWGLRIVERRWVMQR